MVVPFNKLGYMGPRLTLMSRISKETYNPQYDVEFHKTDKSDYFKREGTVCSTVLYAPQC